ncbi:MAG: C4-dicarboxylate transporter [Meiothermus sp.]|uniref:SLAC1 family transporter n=1 Tax=Meiothermus sp. TaxID=1955249 RepID=UPI0025F79C16|nr:C4-dicarboxylate transporter [Meiothermus sp.]MCS7058823.1 C4-dicarboxylate transporter [Meiothermus sp.]MCS7194077.1 C4-dicarboxylate transporter [Meiothermus sp.]MCX7740448.1 C4-dicarboxylate transporter [Meiothermus sp.]MDW8091148.1 C4-dicarboxylate transporter [Meiothermus sp.]MDW8480476.1 C4-dicarboxylate transporter [Meiothermus sp.]
MEAALPARPSVRYLNPAWFASVMGTGVLAQALAQFGLMGLALPVYWLALLTLLALLGLYLAKLLRHPQAVLSDLQHPLLSQMLPTLPIALLVMSLATRALPLGAWSVPLGQGLFWLGMPLIFLVGLLVVFVVSTRLRLPLEAANGAWFIPPVSALLVPITAGAWLETFPQAWQQEVWVMSGLFLGIGFFLFLPVMASFLQRLYAHGRLEPHLLPSVFIGLAPVGLLVLSPWRWLEGGVRAGLVPGGWPEAWPVVGLAVWGLGLWWLFYSLALLLDTLLVDCRRAQFHFAPGWWGFVFPLGAFTLATLALARALGSAFLGGLAWGLLLLLGAFWLWVTLHSLRAWAGLGALRPPK